MSEPAENRSISKQQWLFIALIFAAGLMALFFVAQRNSSKNSEPKTPVNVAQDDPVIAILNGQSITKSEFDLAAAYFSLGQVPENTPMSDQEILDRLVQQKLLAGQASDLGILEQSYTKNRLKFAKEQILAEDSAAVLLSSLVSPMDIEEYYTNERIIRSQQIQVKARQIVSPDEAAAREIIRRLDKGESFASLALAFSLDRASREAGGDLGYLNSDMLDPNLSNKIFSGEDGDRLGPFQTGQGWHVVEILSRRQAPIASLEERREAITRLLQAQKLEAKMTELLKNADLQILEDIED